LPTDRQTLQAIAYTYSFVGGKLVSDKQLGHSLLVTQYTCVLCQSHAVCRPIDDEEKGERSNTVNILKADIDKCKSSLLSQNIGTKLPSCHLCGRSFVDDIVFHNATLEHCKTFLQRQQDLGFYKFRYLYGDIDFERRLPSVEPPPDGFDIYLKTVYRSGVVNNMTCDACGFVTDSLKVWFRHSLSPSHCEIMQNLLSSLGPEIFLLRYGDLPLPRHLMFEPVGLWKQSGDTSVTSASVPFTPPVESLSHPFPVTAVSTSDSVLHSVASPQERFDNSFAVSSSAVTAVTSSDVVQCSAPVSESGVLK